VAVVHRVAASEPDVHGFLRVGRWVPGA